MRNYLPNRKSLSYISTIAVFTMLSLSLKADPLYTWVGPASGGNWDTPSNWQVSGRPERDYTPIAIGRGGALLPSTDVNRNIIYTGAVADSQGGKSYRNWLRDITIEQHAPAINQLTLRNHLRLGNSLRLNASHEGSSVLQLRNEDGRNRSETALLRFEMGYQGEAPRRLSINEGGVLDFAGTVRDKDTQAVVINRGSITLNGGRILLRQGVKAGSENSIFYTVNEDVQIRSGEIVFGAEAIEPGQSITDIRFAVDGQFSMSGGHLLNNTKTPVQLWLKGQKSFFLNNARIAPSIIIVLGRNGDQEYLSATGPEYLLLRQDVSTVKTVAITQAGPNIGSIAMIQSSNNATVTLKMGSDLTLREGANLPIASHIAPPPANSTVTYEIDTAGYTLNLLANPDHWKPNAPRNTKAVWHVKGGGTVIANGFDFSAPRVTVVIEPGTQLKDAGGNKYR